MAFIFCLSQNRVVYANISLFCVPQKSHLSENDLLDHEMNEFMCTLNVICWAKASITIQLVRKIQRKHRQHCEQGENWRQSQSTFVFVFFVLLSFNGEKCSLEFMMRTKAEPEQTKKMLVKMNDMLVLFLCSISIEITFYIFQTLYKLFKNS